MSPSLSRPSGLFLRGLSVVALSAVAALALSSCSVFDSSGSSNEPPRDETNGQITETADADVFSIKVGDCLDYVALGSGEINSVPVVPCGEPHDGEVYAEMSLPDGDYPGDDAISQQADTYCYDQFATFVGIPWDDSSLDYSPLTPTADSWDGFDDRLIQCVVASQDDVTESFKGSQL